MGITSSTARVAVVAGTTYLGCHTDLTGALNNTRSLPDAYVASSDMSVDKCSTIMAGYKYFGVEYANECFGADNFSGLSELSPPSECNFECAGATDEECGAAYRLNVYQNNAPSRAPSQCPFTVTSYLSGTKTIQPISTITVPTTTIFAPSGSQTATVSSTITTSISISTTSASTSTISTSQVSTLPSAAPSAAAFYIYVPAKNQHMYYDGSRFYFSVQPQTTFNLVGTALTFAGSTTPIGVNLNFSPAGFVPLDLGSPSVPTCAIDPSNGTLTCSISTFGHLAFCDTVAELATPPGAVLDGNPPFSNSAATCYNYDFVTLPTTSYQPYMAEAVSDPKSTFYIRIGNYLDGDYYLAADGSISTNATHRQAYYLSGFSLFPVGSSTPMSIQSNYADFYKSPLGVGSSFNQSINCQDGGDGTVRCDEGFNMRYAAVCAGGVLQIIRYYDFSPSLGFGCNMSSLIMVPIS